jgi:hypothetical protein
MESILMESNPITSVLSALGIATGRSSKHQGSKPGHTHVTDTAQDAASKAQAAQAWSAATGRPIPPQLRARQPLTPARRRSSSWRMEVYGGRLTPARFRRLTRKAGMNPAQREALREQVGAE